MRTPLRQLEHRAHWPPAPGCGSELWRRTDAGWADHPRTSTEQCPPCLPALECRRTTNEASGPAINVRLAYPTGIIGSALGFPNWAPGPRDGRGSYPTNWIVLRLITHQKPPALVKNGGVVFVLAGGLVSACPAPLSTPDIRMDQRLPLRRCARPCLCRLQPRKPIAASPPATRKPQCRRARLLTTR